MKTERLVYILKMVALALEDELDEGTLPDFVPLVIQYAGRVVPRVTPAEVEQALGMKLADIVREVRPDYILPG